jgi:hypothetical protein
MPPQPHGKLENALCSDMTAFEFVVMSAVLVILGPDALSVDARLFGRRQVEIPEAPPPRDSWTYSIARAPADDFCRHAIKKVNGQSGKIHLLPGLRVTPCSRPLACS